MDIRRILLIGMVFMVVLLGGCRVENEDDIESKEAAVTCVEESGDSIAELYAICVDNNIKWIRIADESDILDWAVNIAYDDKYYLISTPEGNSADPTNTVFLRGCEILGQLNSHYSIDSVRYFSDKSIEICFSNNSRAIMYSPESLPHKDLNAEKITDGFYTYMLKPMF